jgi:hypothetical protein
MTEVFYVDDGKGGYYEINVNLINYLALFATTLEPLPEVTEANGYAAALEEYYSHNNDRNSDCYKKLVSSYDGRIFLCTAIQIALYEKEFRMAEMNEKDFHTYKDCLNLYRNRLTFNHEMYCKDNNEGKKSTGRINIK